jgi:hypothetical protein
MNTDKSINNNGDISVGDLSGIYKSLLQIENRLSNNENCHIDYDKLSEVMKDKLITPLMHTITDHINEAIKEELKNQIPKDHSSDHEFVSSTRARLSDLLSSIIKGIGTILGVAILYGSFAYLTKEAKERVGANIRTTDMYADNTPTVNPTVNPTVIENRTKDNLNPVDHNKNNPELRPRYVLPSRTTYTDKESLLGDK